MTWKDERLLPNSGYAAVSFAPTPTSKRSLQRHVRELYKRFCEHLPLIKRKGHLKLKAQLEQKLDALADVLLELPARATDCPCTVVIPPGPAHVPELCMFVTFAAVPSLKPHVIDHLHALADQGIAAILIINTEFAAGDLQLPAELTQRLHGLLVRKNLGFDFAAWAQAFCMQAIPPETERLYLINDSMVGPLNREHYAALLSAIRKCPADCVGLTENAVPRVHLQSFFMVINQRLLHAPVLANIMRSVVNLPTKADVIAIYETHLTHHLRQHGFTCQALFANSSPRSPALDDTIFNWAQLVERGMPFIKGSVLDLVRDTPEARRLIPARYRDPQQQ